MTPTPIQPVILCGGSGTRLWPLSRADFPKQFLNLLGAETLFQQAARRLASLSGDGIDAAPLLVVSNEAHRFLILDQLNEAGLEPAALLLEPAGRNTAPALALAALAARGEGGDPVLVVTPADQTMADGACFMRSLRQAIAQAAEGAIVILGVTPDRPETGYGYIRAVDGHTVERFIEKPDQSTAEVFLKEGGYFWNGGMFVLKASVWLAALERFRPDIAKAMTEAWRARQADGTFIRPGTAAFEASPAESIDYAVIEKCPGQMDIRMVPLESGWSDLGSWDAVWQAADRDGSGNVHSGDVMISGGQNVLVHASHRLVGVVGLSDVVVVETPDAVLVADRARSQEVKAIVAEQAQHRKVHRPWGWYDNIDEGPGFRVKRIMVKPGASLSLQKHVRRAEHWVVVSGVAEVTCGAKTFRLTQNQSTYIPLGETHRLANPGAEPLEIIEVQSGDYLGEDDIVRIEDNYGRQAS